MLLQFANKLKELASRLVRAPEPTVVAPAVEVKPQAAPAPKSPRPSKLGPDGEALIKFYEQCRLKAYADPGSPRGKELAKPLTKRSLGWEKLPGDPWTIGWGRAHGVKEGDVVTQARADEMFREDAAQFEKDVAGLVKVAISQKMFDALVSFAYNCGSDIDEDTKAEGLGDSSLLRLVNAGQHAEAAQEFVRWNKSGGVVMRGLTERREKERDLFLKGLGELK